MTLLPIIMAEEVPTTESGKHEFIREHLYDTSKGECADGESCSLIFLEAEETGDLSFDDRWPPI